MCLFLGNDPNRRDFFWTDPYSLDEFFLEDKNQSTGLEGNDHPKLLVGWTIPEKALLIVYPPEV